MRFLQLSDDKKKMYYYYGGKEKKASEAKEGAEKEITPYRFSDIQRDFDRLMDRFEREFEDFAPRWRHGMRWRGPMMPFEARMPSVDLEDQGKEYRLTADMPGFNKEDVELDVTEDSVTINAKKTEAKEEKEKNYVRRERRAQTFYRRIPLPEEVRSDEAKAALNNGILEVTLPKKQPKETKKIKID